MAVATPTTSDAPTVPGLAPRIRRSESSSSVTSLRLLLSETSARLQSTPRTSCPSCMLNCTIASPVLYTPRWSGTGPENPAKTGENSISLWRCCGNILLYCYINVIYTFDTRLGLLDWVGLSLIQTKQRGLRIPQWRGVCSRKIKNPFHWGPQPCASSLNEIKTFCFV